ncbi:hypothetical protein PAECIP111802_07291 [Paenibacillus allorhizosphaerae]|uniref:Uncharacterized protein n=1 Tax=Paenibacillus allorhizosphaerae TaxID=2849866 RepID=A0ABN7TX69_9BACL|nr:hypothetical protein PAECIP111802_07291 [Paenibacillus allorhizosphaerae]
MEQNKPYSLCYIFYPLIYAANEITDVVCHMAAV